MNELSKNIRSWNACNTRSEEESRKVEEKCNHIWFGVGGTGVSKCMLCQKCVSED